MQQLTALLTSLLIMAAMFAAIAQTPAAKSEPESGVEKGKSLPAYNPKHVTGPDKGTTTCPV